MKNVDMKLYGLSEDMKAKSGLYPDLYVGRVISQYKNLYKLICENGEILAEVSGKFRYESKEILDYPTVGDFVMIDRPESVNGNAIIHYVLPRKSAFIRKAAGPSQNQQIIASNIDTVFICMSLNNDFNIRRLERYLAVAWDSMAMPVIVLTKSDLCNDLEEKLLEASSIGIGVDIITTNVNDDSYTGLTKYIKEGHTIAFIGSSGVGKSSLINKLIGEDKYATNEIGDDDKGRHTTTRRELIMLEKGGMVIDTPGMRELGLENAHISKTFSDIEELALKCKFRNCSHKTEPGCAILEAIESNLLDEGRLYSYNKLKKEAKYEGLNSKQIETEKINNMFNEFSGIKNAKKYIKEKNKHR